MEQKRLSTHETLIKEMSEVQANKLAKTLIEERKDVDATQNISVALAKVLPLIKSSEVQSEIYQLLIQASAGYSSLQTQLSSAVMRIQELTEKQLDEATKSIQIDETQDINAEAVDELS